jgi:Zn-dependent peptidase ImmA (M78 family)/DNA-binding XRE family transcriptional regulator
MRTGTPGFQPQRLREAREARGMTATQLAELVGISRNAVSQYETGKTSPSHETFHVVAAKLNMPPGYFLQPSTPAREGKVFYRSMASATKLARSRAERKYGWLREVFSRLSRYVDFPPNNLPAWEVPEDPSKLSEQAIESYAEELRTFWGLGKGPISDLVCLLENNGIIVSRLALDAATLDGFSEWVPEERRAYVVLASDKDAAVRSRFDAAHELAHLVLHRNIDRKSITSKDQFRLIEQQAHRFAGAFLLPEATFRKELLYPSLEVFATMKSKWLVSIGVMIVRCTDLGIIDEDEKRRFWMSMSSRGWRRLEPLDDQLSPEQPRLLREAIVALDEAQVLRRRDFLNEAALSKSDLAALCSLSEGFFDEDRPSVRIIDIREDASEADANHSKGSRPL